MENKYSDMVKEIRYRLLDGDASGVREVGIPFRNYKLVVFPRNRLRELKESGLSEAGIYFLFGEGEDGQSRCYIGQSKNVLERIKQHNVTKDFWQLAAGFVGDFGTTEIEHLEWQCVVQARKVGRFTVENSDEPSRMGKHTNFSLNDEPLAEVFLDLQQFLTMISQPVLEELASRTMSETDIYTCKTVDGFGKGYYSDEGFVVMKGSLVRTEVAPSQPASYKRLLEQLRQDGVLAAGTTGQLEFIRDYVFTSPSTAGSVIQGRPVNGWTEWKNTAGQTLDAVYRKQTSEPTNNEPV